MDGLTIGQWWRVMLVVALSYGLFATFPDADIGALTGLGWRLKVACFLCLGNGAAMLIAQPEVAIAKFLWSRLAAAASISCVATCVAAFTS